MTREFYNGIRLIVFFILLILTLLAPESYREPMVRVS